MTESKCYDIDTFFFEKDDYGRLYIWGVDWHALHYDIENNYDVIEALIDFSRPHDPLELDYSHPRNKLHREEIQGCSHLNYPTSWMSEEGVRKLYKLINGVDLNFNYSHANFVDRCEHASLDLTKIQKINGIKVKTSMSIERTFGKVNNRNLENPDYNNWRNRILNRDRFCQCCGHDDKLQVHHLFGYKENPSLATNDGNGIVLCKFCHDKYHSIYGVKNINPIDFVDFIKRFGVK